MGNYSKIIDRKCKMLKEIVKVSEKFKLSKKPMEYINKILEEDERTRNIKEIVIRKFNFTKER